jgi:hypothetical protein
MSLSRLLTLLSLLVAFSGPALADAACDALKPNPPRNMSQEITGKLDVKLEGLAKRLLNAGGNIDGTYKDTSNDVLKEYPNADSLYVWERMIYLACASMPGMSPAEKLDQINKLMDRIQRPAPR